MMDHMDFLRTLAAYASSAWNFIAGEWSFIGKGLSDLWNYITSEHNILAWLARNPVLRFYYTVLAHLTTVYIVLRLIHAVLARLGTWVWAHEVYPLKVTLQREIKHLSDWAHAEFVFTWALIERRYQQALAYTRYMVGIERAQRIQAINREHADMLAGDKATLATVQQQATSAYDAGVKKRVGIVGDLLGDLATRTPAVKDTINFIVDHLIDIVDVEDPVLNYLLNKALNEVLDKSGIDKATADLVQQLLSPIIGGPRPSGLHDVIVDVDGRITALEDQWAGFMKAGGPEVEQAGQEWKKITGLIADLGLIGMVSVAVADPTAWAAAISDTVGVAADDALTGIVKLIGGL